MSSIVRIGNAQAFWGDRSSAAAEMLAREPELDYLTLDYLAEVSMSILAVQRDRDPTAGYARDFLEVIRSLAEYWAAGGRCRLITNAGGLNPEGCADACRRVLEVAGCRSLNIGVVTGDDVLNILKKGAGTADEANLYRHLDTGDPIGDVVDRLVTANAYVGARPIVDALAQGADLVITGRTADPSLTVAACLHHFKWPAADWNRLAGATVAGHLIECGTQVTGGISTEWLEIASTDGFGFPIVEVADDGSCVVTKPRRTGGRVSEQTVKEQLLYEIGDPGHYLSPDVSVSFLSLSVNDLGDDRVEVRGATGSPPPSTYKVSATYRDGYRAVGTLTVVGRNSVAKAHLMGDIVFQRVLDAGHHLRDLLVECLGQRASVRGIVARGNDPESWETILRVGVEAETRDAAECFSRELMPLVTSGPQGVCGYADGRPRVQPVVRYWPCLIDREVPQVHVDVQTTDAAEMPARSRPIPGDAGSLETAVQTTEGIQGTLASPPRTLYDIAYARSGDKGINANVGIIVRKADDYPHLVNWLTEERVADYFKPLGIDGVERFELPNLRALNFLLYGVLRHRLRTDTQGKALGQALLEMPLGDSFLPR